MYIDKDSNGNFSIMKIKPAEINELGALLREFEFLAPKSDFIPETTKAGMIMNSAKLRFLIIDAVK